MRREVLLITLLNKLHGMVYLDGNVHLELLYWKSLHYNGGGNEMRQILDERNDPFKKTESDIV